MGQAKLALEVRFDCLPSFPCSATAGRDFGFPMGGREIDMFNDYTCFEGLNFLSEILLAKMGHIVRLWKCSTCHRTLPAAVDRETEVSCYQLHVHLSPSQSISIEVTTVQRFENDESHFDPP
jgi:hypothetical protein